jgi:hypothetical protein
LWFRIYTNNEISSFASESEVGIAMAYSGDLTDFNKVKVHNITNIRRFNGVFSMAKLCPRVIKYTPVSLVQSVNYDYKCNITGKVIYFKPKVKVCCLAHFHFSRGCFQH